MRTLLPLLCVLFLAAPAGADGKDKPKPNTLTAKEIADGWVLLFDGETTFGWKVDGAAEVKDGVLILGKDKKTTALPTTNFGASYQLKLEWQGGGGVAVGSTGILHNKKGVPSDTWTAVEFQRDGDLTKVQVNGTKFDYMGEVDLKPDHPTIRVEAKGEVPALIRSIKLRPLNTKPLFDGKSLGGWKVNAADPKRMASKFEVTKDGEIAVKNGPGDLVTEKEFDNFVLQFECKTLGDGLNSGIFFRCIPGQYQNGYEAQVQNAFLDNDRTKPKDFGTGAIYRRVAARKVVSNDKEWFTMTVVADGKHIATWVNGYQTVDWTDDRKESDNPRQGYRAAKGPLSIQGHDPTTDLLFRNLRVAELGEKK